MATVESRYQFQKPVVAEPTTELLSEFLEQGQRLLRQEMLLAKEELRAEGKAAARAGGMFGAAAGMAAVAALALTATVILLLSTFLPAWFAALLVTAALGAGAVIVAKAAKTKWDLVKGPQRTIQTMKEDGEWLRQTLNAAKLQLRARA